MFILSILMIIPRIKNVITSYCLPVTHEVDVTEVGQHKKTVSCIAIDRAGARMATGSFDYEVKMQSVRRNLAESLLYI